MKHQLLSRLPWLLMTLGWWSLLLVVVFKVDPAVMADVIVPHTYLPVMGLVFLTVTFSVTLIRNHLIKGLIWGLAIAIFLELRIIGIGNYLNFLLILGLLVTVEYYWHATEMQKPLGSTN